MLAPVNRRYARLTIKTLPRTGIRKFGGWRNRSAAEGFRRLTDDLPLYKGRLD